MTAHTWQSVRDEVLARIRNRTWPPGSMIPGETDLAVEFDCARATVNRALRTLAEAGLLERRRKTGTRVTLNPARRAVLSIPILRDEVEATGAAYSYALLTRAVGLPPSDIATRLGLAEGVTALAVTALHYTDAKPFVHEDRWINPAAAPGILTADLSQISANEWLVQNAPFAHGELWFSATAADAALATALQCPPGTALFQLERTTWSDQSAVTFARLNYRPGYRLGSVV